MRAWTISLVAIFLTSCSLVSTDSEKINLGTTEQAISYIRDNMKNKTEFGEQWRLPTDIYADMQGDCDDSAMLLASSIEANGGEASLIAVYFPGAEHLSSGFHMVCEYTGIWYSAQWNYTDPKAVPAGTWTEWGRWTFEQAIECAQTIF